MNWNQVIICSSRNNAPFKFLIIFFCCLYSFHDYNKGADCAAHFNIISIPDWGSLMIWYRFDQPSLIVLCLAVFYGSYGDRVTLSNRNEIGDAWEKLWIQPRLKLIIPSRFVGALIFLDGPCCRRGVAPVLNSVGSPAGTFVAGTVDVKWLSLQVD